MSQVTKIVTRDAGRELDALVRDAVFGPWDESRCRVCGWKLVADGEQGCWKDNCSLRPPPYRRADEPQHYSTDMRAAWAVVTALDERGKSFSIERRRRDSLSENVPATWLANFWAPLGVGESVSAPHAICLAALGAAPQGETEMGDT